MQRSACLRGLSFLVLLLALSSRALPAQAVRGTLVDGGSGSPLPGTLVVLADAEGKQVAGALTDAGGAFLLRAPAPGRYRLRAEPIGRPGAVSPPLDLAAGQTLEHRLAAPGAAFALEGLVVRRERKRCRALPQAGEQAAAVWEEVRKALNVTAWTERQRAFTFRLARHERELDPASLAVRRETTDYVTGTAANPYRSLPPEDLAERGYVESAGDGTVYFAPDARVLLSDEFLDAHCFRVEPGGRGEPGMVGLAFEPTREAKGIHGVLWVDRRTGELRHLDFRYPAADLDGPTGHLGGRVEFERLPGGAWVVRRWRIRMPLVAQRVGSFAGARVASSAVWAIREEGGEIVEVRTLAGELVRASGRARLAGVVYDSASAGPLEGAGVRLVGTPFAARTDGEGSFRMGDLPEGRYRVELDHPRLDSLGVAPAGREVELRRDAESRVELAAPSARTVLAQLCPGGIGSEQGVLAGTVQGAAGEGQGTAVTVDWSRWDLQNEQHAGSAPVIVQQSRTRATATLDDRGRYRVCGVPAEVTLRVHVAHAGVEGAPETVRLGRGEVRVHHLRTPSRGSGGGAAGPGGAAPAEQPVAVEGVTVVATPRDRRLEGSGFYDRQKMGAGAFFTGKQLEGRDLPAVIRSSGVQVRRLARGFVALAPRSPGSGAQCSLPVFVDGVMVPPSGTAALLAAPVAAVEVYRDHAEVPPRFRSRETRCGAVVVWTAPRR